MTAAAQRTPASLLLEMCNQNDWKVEYELTAVQGASHDPTFTYRVTVEDVVATASGQSKRKAKHFAAKSALEQLLSNPDSSKNSFHFENTTVTLKNLNDVILEPSSEPVPMGKDSRNAIGELQEWCMKRKMMPPCYETIGDIGPPHDRTFSIRCIVDEHVTFGEGKTKREGKRAAAEIMYKKLLLNTSSDDALFADKNNKQDHEEVHNESEEGSALSESKTDDLQSKDESKTEDFQIKDDFNIELDEKIESITNGISEIQVDSEYS